MATESLSSAAGTAGEPWEESFRDVIKCSGAVLLSAVSDRGIFQKYVQTEMNLVGHWHMVG